MADPFPQYDRDPGQCAECRHTGPMHVLIVLIDERQAEAFVCTECGHAHFKGWLDEATFHVDIPDPQNLAGEWVEVGSFSSQKEAVDFVRAKLNGDDEGRITLVTQAERERPRVSRLGTVTGRMDSSKPNLANRPRPEPKFQIVEGWRSDNVQFARLLAEIRALGLTKRQLQDLSWSMDLSVTEIEAILERAEQEFERVKRNTLGGP